MKDEEGFLQRWSRRKQAASQSALEARAPEGAAGAALAATPETAPLASEPPHPFDPGSLPPLDSIGAGSDLEPFLAAGVPPELMRAALRRAWLSDPAIRDFIGLSENSWDFTAPGSMGGFGPLKAEEVRELLAQAIGAKETSQSEQLAERTASEGVAPSTAGQALPAAQAGPEAETKLSGDSVYCDAAVGRKPNDNNGAMQHRAGETQTTSEPPKRSHGGALPK